MLNVHLGTINKYKYTKNQTYSSGANLTGVGEESQNIAYKQHNEPQTVRFHIKNPKKRNGDDRRVWLQKH